MRVHTCDHHDVPLPPGHRFPMGKYGLLRELLLSRGVLAADELVPVPPVEPGELLRAHDAAYVEAFLEGRLDAAAQRRIGLPWSPELVRRSLASVNGTILSARAALQDGISGSLAGGTHHAAAGAGSGYCVWNDIAVAARHLQAHGLARRVLVVDLDVHQGDGTARIFEGDATVFTLSLHGAGNFPFRKARSDLDVELPDGTGDEAYLEALAPALRQSFERSRADVVLYQGGVDPLAEDQLGRLSLTHRGLRERDRMVMDRARTAGLPLVLTLGGGYARPIEATLEAHVATYEEARRSLVAPPVGAEEGACR